MLKSAAQFKKYFYRDSQQHLREYLIKMTSYWLLTRAIGPNQIKSSQTTSNKNFIHVCNNKTIICTVISRCDDY